MAPLAVRLSAGPVTYNFRFLSASDQSEASGQELPAPDLDFDRNGFFTRGSMDPSTTLFLTPLFFWLPVWGNGFHFFDFGDNEWGWGSAYSGYLPQANCFRGFCREAEAPVAAFLPALDAASEPPSGGSVAAVAPPAVNLSPSASLESGLGGPFGSADEPVAGNPEPGTLVLLATGLAAAYCKRRKN
jgi:hypothetical protein